MTQERKSDRQTLIAMLEYIRQSIEPQDTTAAYHIAVAMEHMAEPEPKDTRMAERLH